MAYKKLIKVSNVCQLLGKSKFLATQTINGVTFTNNGDGTITVNGTATKSSSIGTEIKNWTPIIGHKILVSGCPEGGGANTFSLGAFNQRGAIDYGNGAIGSVITTGKWFGIIFNSGVTFDNLIFKPQLFDLTEMYGAGNEPTTVEQFRQDFPEELYDYSPYCWLTSYKRVFMTGGGNYLTSYQRNLTCKTKNLFDIDSVSNLNNWVDKQSIDRPYGYYQFNLKPNTTYTFQRNYKSRNNEVFACFSKKYGVSDEQGFFIHPTDSYLTRKQLSFTTDDTGIMYLNAYRVRGVLSSFIELIEGAQLELGDIATDYVPYGHL